MPFNMFKVRGNAVHVFPMGANRTVALDATHLALRVCQGFVNGDGIPLATGSNLAFQHHLKNSPLISLFRIFWTFMARLGALSWLGYLSY